VPVAAALVAGYLVYERVQEIGPSITIKFKDGSGLRTGLTPLKYRGVSIGEVVAIGLSSDHHYVLATVRLRRSLASMADEGATFWIVRPEVGLGNITGLSTVITGPEIQMQPGTGPPRSEFVGLESAPTGPDRKGLGITLHGTPPWIHKGADTNSRAGAVGRTRIQPRPPGDVQANHSLCFEFQVWRSVRQACSGALISRLESRLDALSTPA